MRANYLDLVRQVPLFADLPQQAAERLLHAALLQHLPRGALLCVQGEAAAFLHVVLSGRVTLLAAEPDRGETVVEFFEAGDILVAPAVLLSAPYLMSARMAQDGRVLFIPAAQVHEAMTAEPKFAVAMAMQLARYWRKLVRQIKDLKLHRSTERLAAYLVAMAPDTRGATTISLPEDRKLIAARLGMTPESLSRAFLALRKLGVGGRGRDVTIEDPERLRAYCKYDDVL